MIPWHSAQPSRGGRAPALSVSCQPGLAGQVLSPGDVSFVVVFDPCQPFGPGPLHRHGMHGAAGVDGAAGGIAAMRVRPGVARVLQHPQHPGVGKLPPAQLPGPRAAVGAQREPAVLERRDDPVSRPAGGEHREHVPDRGLDLGIGSITISPASSSSSPTGSEVRSSPRPAAARLLACSRCAITCSSISPMVPLNRAEHGRSRRRDRKPRPGRSAACR